MSPKEFALKLKIRKVYIKKNVFKVTTDECQAAVIKKSWLQITKNLTWQNPRILYYVLLQVNETNPTKSFPTEVSDGHKAIIAR